MRISGTKMLIFLLAFCVVVPLLCVHGVAESSVNISASCDGNAYSGGEIIVKITLSKPQSELAGLEFSLYYNSEYVKPKIVANSEEGREMNALVSKMPLGWEQMSYHSELDSCYRFRFSMPFDKESYLNTASGIVLEIPFTVIQAGSFDFYIPDNEIIAIKASDMAVLGGSGSKITVSASSEEQKLFAEIISSDFAHEGQIYNLKIKVTNLGDAAGIIAAEFKLTYDNTAFAPTITANDSAQMDAFMTNMPQNSWEQMCSLNGEDGIYTLRFAANTAESTDKSEKLLQGSSFYITVPFKAIASEGNIGRFSISSASVIALNNKNEILTGGGSVADVLIEATPEGLIPEDTGYLVENGILYYVDVEMQISDLLEQLKGFYIVDKNGSTVSDGTVCTGYILKGKASFTLAVRGDIDGTGTADSFDYILARRIYFETFSPDELQRISADVNGDGEINQFDYILIKRHYFGTIDINKVQ